MKLSLASGTKEIEIKANEILLFDTLNCDENRLITSELSVCDKKINNYLYTYDEKIDYKRYKELLTRKD
ncbi:MAG: hypothetical protein SO373_05400 [Candidatus Borkfalkiaceae bacterium]|nr:hypothetical protein [Christensenellaceae bacterium]